MGHVDNRIFSAEVLFCPPIIIRCNNNINNTAIRPIVKANVLGLNKHLETQRKRRCSDLSENERSTRILSLVRQSEFLLN